MVEVRIANQKQKKKVREMQKNQAKFFKFNYNSTNKMIEHSIKEEQAKKNANKIEEYGYI